VDFYTGGGGAYFNIINIITVHMVTNMLIIYQASVTKVPTMVGMASITNKVIIMVIIK
jgi:hypothetical protein